MRRRILDILVLAIAVSCAPLSAQQRPAPFLGGGPALGTGDLHRDSGTGWAVSGGLDFPVSTYWGIYFGVSGRYAHVPYNGSFGEATDVSAALGEIVYRFENYVPSATPYLRGGGGIVMQRYDPGSIATRVTTEARPGISAGAGLDINAGSLAVRIAADFVSSRHGGYVGVQGGIAFPARASSAPAALRTRAP